jgi:hypothetical protein
MDAGLMNKERPPDIRRRAYQYALRAIRLFQYLQKQKDSAGWILGKQYLRAATSIGANIVERSSQLADEGNGRDGCCHYSHRGQHKVEKDQVNPVRLSSPLTIHYSPLKLR